MPLNKDPVVGREDEIRVVAVIVYMGSIYLPMELPTRRPMFPMVVSMAKDKPSEPSGQSLCRSRSHSVIILLSVNLYIYLHTVP